MLRRSLPTAQLRVSVDPYSEFQTNVDDHKSKNYYQSIPMMFAVNGGSTDKPGLWSTVQTATHTGQPAQGQVNDDVDPP